ncbi:MAG: GNAT family N-acetyltransferase [Clostridia bacterium]|nr:GNAT family N-acetyltransferase [Clostridia bacterium]
MEIKILESGKNSVSEYFRMGAVDGEGEIYSKGNFRYRNTAFGGCMIKTMTAGGIATPVHLRRGGNVRKIFEFMHQKAYSDGVGVAILHPFSFAYYNKFGYEKMADHIIARVPIRYVDFVPRRCTLKPYSEDMLSDVIEVYGKFARERYLLFERKTAEQFNAYKDAMTYVCYIDGKAEGYITFTTEKRLEINHFEDGVMRVKEMVYTCPEALRELFSFIRMYEGELEDVEFANLSMTPDVDMMMRNYTHTSYRILPDIAAKIINTEMMLTALSHPASEGKLSLSIPEGDDGVRGNYLAEWGGNDIRVKRLSEKCDTDLTLTPCALARLTYGYDNLTPLTLPYLTGIEVSSNAEGACALFTKKPVGLFEHF